MASQSVTGSIRHEIGALLASSHKQHLPQRMHPSLFSPNPSPSPILKFDRSRGHAANTPAPAPVQLEDGANSREERRRRKRRKKKKSQKRNSKIPRKIWGIDCVYSPTLRAKTVQFHGGRSSRTLTIAPATRRRQQRLQHTHSVGYGGANEPPSHCTRQSAISWSHHSTAAAIVQCEQQRGSSHFLPGQLRELRAQLGGEGCGDGHAEAEGAARIIEHDYGAVWCVARCRP